MNPPTEFIELSNDAGIEFDVGDLDRLGRFLDLLLDANRRMNLTAIRDPVEAWTRHIFDSLTLLPLIEGAEAQSLIDVGSGGGAPGVPLAVCCPRIGVTLLEATAKKASFLQHVINDLALTNCSVVNDRAETAGHDRNRIRERFDIATARAVGPLKVVLELALPLVRAGGFLLAIKGAKARDEIDEARGALQKLHARVTDTIPTPTGTIVVVEKLRATPKLYPRKSGEPKRNPMS